MCCSNHISRSSWKTEQLASVSFSSCFLISLYLITLYRGVGGGGGGIKQTVPSTHTQAVKEHKGGLRWWVGWGGGGQREKCQRGDKDNTIWLQMIVSVISMDLGLHRSLSRAFLWWHRQSFHWVNDDVEVELPLLLVPAMTLWCWSFSKIISTKHITALKDHIDQSSHNWQLTQENKIWTDNKGNL